MIGILLITHETLGAAYRDLAQHFFPDQENRSHIHILNVDIHDDHASIIDRAAALLPETDRGAGVLILTDIFGATPCNAAMKLVVPQRSAMITGLNAPMLIKAVSHSAQAQQLTEFAETVRAAGVQGIMLFAEPLC
ncbi:PTS sugar transporter subunit IIA [Conchiformibius steedae]|uniref:PTS mannose transporter subunit IIA n=1 Tax=Conchiformibius steedae TaxID=153493 RepID=A0A3P2A3W4_9NEIS|nr:PTS mannose transporter subunit IIA [Conchiformibius steedae]MDO5357755.1 PTS mannose transporter subunit IIA [Conchiformibius sp.]RRD89608.1 PTS mannose transporter subunit IIA [Conchiformibius steedae]